MNKNRPMELRLFDSLRQYCEKRWKIQDIYFESCFKLLRKYTNRLFYILLIAMFLFNGLLVFEMSKLEQRVQTIEETWSE